ncbi:MAG: cupin domain-containing protein [Acidimicrobiia bacterium]
MNPPGRTIQNPLTGEHLTFLEPKPDSDDGSLRAEVRLEPGGFVPRHLHLRQDERLEVLAGSVRFRSGGEDRVLAAGDTAVTTRRRFHRVANAGAGEAVFVLEVRPARHIEQTMRSMFAIGRVLRPLARLRNRR